MAYATLEALIKQYGLDAVLLVADRDQDGDIDADVVEQALADATAEIDTYVGAKHRLPLPAVPPVLERLCCDVALYRMSSDGGSLTEEKRQRYEDAVSLLIRIAGGSVSLGMPTPDEQETSGEAWFEAQPVRFGKLL
ncbi:gp436 family protein [Ectopseudomonas mendocina]|uniref:gp436 family protein n=1 Tax=Ectopseudomonas mendocina TaxID=300 RepID=UPI0005AAA6C2|nr:phage protein Gp36 family protein [Pseudomonas mendocina]VEE17578.1 Mu-like prophage protein gp36 [Pseudomonas mendocina]